MSKDEAKDQADMFLLKKQFPDTTRILGVVAPRLSVLARDCLFVLDTNVLLAPYKVGEKGVADIGRVYRMLSADGRLLVPSQALREFARNRHVTLVETFDHINKNLSQLPSVSSPNLPMLEGRAEYDEVKDKINELKASIAKYKDALSSLVGVVADWTWDDSISSLYRELFVAAAVCDTKLNDEELKSDLMHRTTNKHPPGYKDGGKLDGGIGDLIIWHSILEVGILRQKDVLFVSNEQKPDWVVSTQGKALATRPELASEFYGATAGRHLAVISYPRFLEVAGATSETVGIVRSAASLDGPAAGNYLVELAIVADILRHRSSAMIDRWNREGNDSFRSDPELSPCAATLNGLSHLARHAGLLPSRCLPVLELLESETNELVWSAIRLDESGQSVAQYETAVARVIECARNVVDMADGFKMLLKAAR